MESTSGHLALLTTPTVLELLVDGEQNVPTQAEFRYNPSDPYAVQLVVSSGEVTRTWLFARELLVVGLVEAAGLGDIQIWPGFTDVGEVVLIELASEEDEVILAARSSEVTRFLDRTFDLVGVGAETDFCDVDALITMILSSV